MRISRIKSSKLRKQLVHTTFGYWNCSCCRVFVPSKFFVLRSSVGFEPSGIAVQVPFLLLCLSKHQRRLSSSAMPSHAPMARA